MKTSVRQVDDHGNIYTALMFVCPGCALGGGSGVHMLPVNSPNKTPQWTWNGDEEKPTLSPSIMTGQGTANICHSFLTDGVFQFLSDCTHELAGKDVPMVDLPEWADQD